jgi:hypothetical protein
VIDLRVASRDRKTAIVGGIVVLSLLGIGRGAPVWYRWRGKADEFTRVTLTEASEAAASVKRAREVAAANQRAELQKMEVAPAFVNGSAVATAASNLAAVVVDAATGNGVRMGSLQTTVDSMTLQREGVVHLRVIGEATGDVTAVTQFLAAIESGLPLIAVRELAVTQAEPTAPADRSESLHVRFVIEGLAHIDRMDRNE